MLAGPRPAISSAAMRALDRARWHGVRADDGARGSAWSFSIVVWNRLVPRVPGYIVALVGGTLAAAILGLPVETVGSRFGGIPAGLPHLQVPAFRPDLILTLLAPTFTVAMLGAIESLMSAVVADRMAGTRHNSNVELFAQGIANIASPLVGGLPATGAIARTATNVRAGARTPVAGIVHALTLLVILLAAAPLAAAVPMTVLAGDPAGGVASTWANGTRFRRCGSSAGPIRSSGWRRSR